MNIIKLRSKIQADIDVLYSYQINKLESRDDDHAVADAAMDIRELKAQIIIIDRILNGEIET